MKQITFIVDKNGNPLMPTFNQSKVRKLLKEGKAKKVNFNPFFVIQLEKEVEISKPKLVLGIDAGYSFVGFSLIDEHENELIGGELKLRNDIKGLLDTKSMYRTQRRSRLRYRKARFNNRKMKNKYYIDGKEKSLPPSIQNKIYSHTDLINRLYKIAPIKKINIELANFDIQKINNPDIKNEEYQEGLKFGFWNLREAVLFRDNHKCQNPNCKGKSNILSVHHLVYRSKGGTDSATNLITLCTDCHTPKNHKPSGFLYKWMKEKKKVTKNFKDSTFMNIIRWNILNELKSNYDIEIKMEFGFNTKHKRIENKIDKTHHTDAYVIAGGTINSKIGESLKLKRLRRNDRSLESFRDAKYYDRRENLIDKNGKQKKPTKVTASSLSCGRTKRNKNLNTENLRKYRVPILDKNGKKDKRSKGMRIIRTQRSKVPKGTIVELLKDINLKGGNFKKGERFEALGTMNKGNRVYIKKDLTVNINDIKIISTKNSIIFDK